jgi:phosphatidylglycerol:prolipoprotein diacylglycerol transferase
MLPSIHIGPFTIWSFGLTMVAAFLVGGVLGARQAAHVGADTELVFDLLPWAAASGILGAKLLSMLVHLDQTLAHPFDAFVHSGMVWYGGLIGGVAAAAWRVHRAGIPLSLLFDQGAAPVALAHAVGRIGCFLAGDDYGMPTASWLGVEFARGLPPSSAGYLRANGATIPASVSDATIVAVHPTQLYEAAGLVVIFAILWRASRARRLGAWKVFGLYAALYGAERFLLEAIRPKDDRILWGYTVSQAISAGLVLAAVVLLARRSAPVSLAPARIARSRGGESASRAVAIDGARG